MNDECTNAIALLLFSVMALPYLAKKIVGIAKTWTNHHGYYM